MSTRPLLRIVPGVLLAAAVALPMTAAGPINPPPGPVVPTPGPEPRIAVNATNTPGDADASPSLFKITQPGSYYLTGSITGVIGKHGIEIAASGVTLDLNGFDVLGTNGSLDGVRAAVSGLSNIAVVNGSIRNWGASGVNMSALTARNCRVDGVLASGNGGAGIDVYDGGTVTNCSAFNNFTFGFNAAIGCVITSCSAYQNFGGGFQAGGGITISNCSAYNNSDSGFSLGAGGTITNCNARANHTFGIIVGSASTVTDCSVSFNYRDGIWCGGPGGVIRGNSCSTNGFDTNDGAGIYVVSTANRVEGNNCFGNDRGVHIDAAGNIIIRNTCSGNSTNWTIAAGNSIGAIVTAGTLSAAISTNGAVAGTLGSTDPNANFNY